MTEKLLLLGQAIQAAGSVKGKRGPHAISDWMALEQERGISVTSSVMQFPYKERWVNLLDTPGHEDFSEDTYRTLASPCEGLFKAKGSKHFGYGFPIASESEVKVHLDALKKQHHAARHVAFAWMLGFDGTHHRSSDDGEPSNSAGPPILGVIRAHELTHVLFAVVR